MTTDIIQLKPKQQRLINQLMVDTDENGELVFLHSAMCQTALPVKNQGACNSWTSTNGGISLNVEARSVLNPQNEWVKLGLPYGPKPRLILSYLNTKAIQNQSPRIDVQKSLRAFLRDMGLDAQGNDFKVVKKQLAMLASSDISIGRVVDNERTHITAGRVIKDFDLWFPKNEKQAVLWESEINMSLDYFQGLIAHAVPLQARALIALRDSALELDLYAMLAERLHRISNKKNQYVYWSVLWRQYGQGYKRINDFRRKFKHHLVNVKAVYPEARFEFDQGGMKLFHSLPPVRKKYINGWKEKGQALVDK